MRSAQFLDNLNDAVRENPVAAGLIGVGLAWMVFGGSKMLVRDTRGAVGAARDTIDTAANAAAEAIEPTVTHVREAASGMSDAVSAGVEAAVSRVSDAVTGGQATPGASSIWKSTDVGRWVSSSGRGLVDVLDRQPLALAAVGVAVGAAIASAFPRTEAEDRFIGSAGETLRETVKDAASTVGDRVSAAIDAATDEAVAQKLTPATAKAALRTGATKLKNVARAGLEATQDR
jgi:hypothetical protein